MRKSFTDAPQRFSKARLMMQLATAQTKARNVSSWSQLMTPTSSNM